MITMKLNSTVPAMVWKELRSEVILLCTNTKAHKTIYLKKKKNQVNSR